MSEPAARLEQRIEAFLVEARDLRATLPPMPDTHAQPVDVHDHLLDIRRRLDRIEHLTVTATRLRAAARRVTAATTHDADDAWDEAILRVRSAPVRRNDEYTSAKERAAEANLATMTARRAAREAAEVLALADEAVDVLRLIHRGLDGTRHDTLTVLRLVHFESTLER